VLKIARVKKITETGKVRAKKTRALGSIFENESFCLVISKTKVAIRNAIANLYSTT